MDKSKEVNKRLTPDCKKVGISKAILKNNHSHIAIKSSAPRKISYISRAKNVSIPFDKKYNIYTTDTKSFLKQTCDKCRIGTGSHLLVNTASVKPPTQLAKVEPGHDLNGNLSFNPHTAFCNFPSVSEVPSFSLSYQAQQHYELSVQKASKHKPRTGFHEKRAFTSKVASSKVPFHSNKFFSPLPHSTISYQNSKSTPATLTNTVPFIKLSTNRMCSDVTEKFNPKCFIKPNELVNEQFTTDIKVANFPVFSQSNLPNKTCFTFQVDPENQLRGIKKSDYFIQKWQQISVASLFENPAEFKDGDKLLFPALPSNVQSEQIKLNSSCTGNMPPSELSYEDQSDLESANSISGVTTTTESSGTSATPIIPQASYADVIRMSATCSGSTVELNKISEPEQNFFSLSEKKDENIQSGSSDWVISRLSQLDLKSRDPLNIALSHYNPSVQNSLAPHPIVVSLEKPSFYNSTLQNSKSMSASLTPLWPSERVVKGDDSVNSLYSFEENTDKMSSSSSAYSSSIPSDPIVSAADGQIMSSKPDSAYSSASSVTNSNNAFKPIDRKVLNKKNIFQNKECPVIIMNNCSPPDDVSEITFGIEYDEMVKLCFDNCDVATENASIVIETNEKSSFSEINKDENSNLKSSEVKSLPDKNSVSELKLGSEDFVKNKLLFKEKELYWKDVDVNYNHSNHMQLTKYFASLWKECERDSGSGSSKCDKIQIYQES